MKKLFCAFLAIGSLIGSLQAQPPKGKAKVGDNYGAAVNTTNAVDIAQLPTILEGQDSADVKVKGVVVDVCPKKGCWMSLQLPDSSTVFVKMKDYDFFVPLAAIGKTVVIDAKAFTKMTSVKELQHYAEDAKKSKEEIEAITEPKKEIRLLANGIVVAGK
jgi:hypothetical protein